MIKQSLIIRLTLAVLVVFVVLARAPVRADEAARDFLDGVSRYNEGHYDEAAVLFEKTAQSGVVNGQLYYNAGNAWFKAGKIGKAMLWYERALRLMPHDPDLVYNHRYVGGLLKDKVEDKPSAVISVLFFWKGLLGRAAIQWTAIVLFGLFWIRVAYVMIRSRKLKVPDVLVAIFALTLSLTAAYDYYDARFNKQAIVISGEVAVRSGLSDSSTQLFVLHSGTRVAVDDQRKGYMKIRFSGDKIGWVKSEDVEII